MEKIKVSSKNLKKTLKQATKVIKEGGVVVCPTDTVYGLLANTKDEKAVKKVLKIKKRRLKKSLPVFVKDLKMAKSLAYINKTQEKFLKEVWFTRLNFRDSPKGQQKLTKIKLKIWAGKGKVTAVLKAKPKKFPKGILSKDKKIGLRIPNYKFLNILLEKLNRPLTGTSANISGKPASTKIKEVLEQFKNQKYQPDLILDAGDLKPSLPSTVINLTTLKILREGSFPKRKILEILDKLESSLK
ncbi:MAG: L-threonylcarbamoyladenylate synthase [Candidatus Paceibacterales bacterium]